MGSPDYSLGKLKGRFVVTWWEGGRRRRFRLRAKITPAQARIEHDQFVRNRTRLLAKEAKTVGDIYDFYLLDREQDGKSVGKQKGSWKALMPFFGHLMPSDIDKATCSKFRKARYAEGRKPGTVWTDLSCLRAALNWAGKNKHLKEVPHIFLPPQPKPQEYHLTRDEADTFIAQCETPHLKVFTHLGLGTAGRATAILDLTWDRVNFETGMIDLRTSEESKVKRRAIIPMNNSLRKVLLEAQEGALTTHVVEWAGERVRSVKTSFRKAAKRAGFPKLTPHVLRHTAAVWMAEADIPMSVISQYLGHSSIRVTEKIYARYSPTYLRRASSALEIGEKRSALGFAEPVPRDGIVNKSSKKTSQRTKNQLESIDGQ